MLEKSLSNPPSVQVLHQQIRGWGVKTHADHADTGGVQDLEKPLYVILEPTQRFITNNSPPAPTPSQSSLTRVARIATNAQS